MCKAAQYCWRGACGVKGGGSDWIVEGSDPMSPGCYTKEGGQLVLSVRELSKDMAIACFYFN